MAPTIQPTLAVFKTRVADKLRLRCNTTFPKIQSELQTELENAEKLDRNGDDMQARLRNLKLMEHELQNQLEEVTNKCDRLQGWITAQTQQSEAIKANLDEYVQPSDALGKQLFNCVAESLAVDDMLYHLNSALVRQKIDLKTFLKQARALSRDQFFKIALALKLNNAQTQPLIPSPPIRLKPAGASSGARGGAGQYPSVPSMHYPSMPPPAPYQ